MPRTAVAFITEAQAKVPAVFDSWCERYEYHGLRLATVEWGPHVPFGAAFRLEFTDEQPFTAGVR